LWIEVQKQERRYPPTPLISEEPDMVGCWRRFQTSFGSPTVEIGEEPLVLVPTPARPRSDCAGRSRAQELLTRGSRLLHDHDLDLDRFNRGRGGFGLGSRKDFSDNNDRKDDYGRQQHGETGR
jgi:hypothetical protein